MHGPNYLKGIGMRLLIAVFGCLSLVSSFAFAQLTLETLKKGNTDFCIEAGTKMPGAPKDTKQIKPYCSCVSDVYWDSVPKKDFEDFIKEQSSDGDDHDAGDRIAEASQPRMKAAMAACKKKIGF